MSIKKKAQKRKKKYTLGLCMDHLVMFAHPNKKMVSHANTTLMTDNHYNESIQVCIFLLLVYLSFSNSIFFTNRAKRNTDSDKQWWQLNSVHNIMNRKIKKSEMIIHLHFFQSLFSIWELLISKCWVKLSSRLAK